MRSLIAMTILVMVSSCVSGRTTRSGETPRMNRTEGVTKRIEEKTIEWKRVVSPKGDYFFDSPGETILETKMDTAAGLAPIEREVHKIETHGCQLVVISSERTRYEGMSDEEIFGSLIMAMMISNLGKEVSGGGEIEIPKSKVPAKGWVIESQKNQRRVFVAAYIRKDRVIHYIFLLPNESLPKGEEILVRIMKTFTVNE